MIAHIENANKSFPIDFYGAHVTVTNTYRTQELPDSMYNNVPHVVSQTGIYGLYCDLTRSINTKAPIAHASTDTTYGIGNATNYGHVKVSDVIDYEVGDASDGIAASQSAVCQIETILSHTSAMLYNHIDNLETSYSNPEKQGAHVTVTNTYRTQELPDSMYNNVPHVVSQTGIYGLYTELNARINTLESKTQQFYYNIPHTTTLGVGPIITFNSWYSVILSVNGINTEGLSAYIVIGYGVTYIRTNIMNLSTKTPITITPLTTAIGFQVDNTQSMVANLYLSVTVLYGEVLSS